MRIGQQTLLLAAAALLLALPLQASFMTPKPEKYRRHVVRVAVTSQTYDYFRPWQKKAPGARHGLGVVVLPGRVLVSASLVTDATFVEVEVVGSGAKSPAVVEQADYMANLALIRIEDPAVAESLQPVKVSERLDIGDTVQACEVDANDTIKLTEGKMQSAEVRGYPSSEMSLLTYRVSIALSGNGERTALPFLHRQRLAGLLMQYSQSTERATLIPAQVISHFLRDLEDGQYDGFPRAGFSFAPVEDPQLRRFVRMDEGDSGVYITEVLPESAAAIAGIQEGDVLMAVDGHEVNKFGEYSHPEYGSLSISHIISTARGVGQAMVFDILRQGERQSVTMTLKALPAEAYPVPPFEHDTAPQYLVAGGLLLQELTRAYLTQWGGSWATRAPHLLRHYERKQWDLVAPGDRVVFLSQVLRSPGNVGYHELNFLIIDRVNGKAIHRLSDVVEALKTPQGGYHRIEFVGRQPREIYLSAESLATENTAIQARYSLPALSRIRE